MSGQQMVTLVPKPPVARLHANTPMLEQVKPRIFRTQDNCPIYA